MSEVMFKIKFVIIFFAACVILFFQCQIFQLSQDLNTFSKYCPWLSYYVIIYVYVLLSENEYYKRLNSNDGVVNINNNNDVIIIYNRVPKTGSTSFIGVAYDICKKNNFHVIHVNISSNNHVLSLPNQYTIVQNVTKWDNMKPAIYHGHFAYLDFSKYVRRKCIIVLHYT